MSDKLTKAFQGAWDRTEKAQWIRGKLGKRQQNGGYLFEVPGRPTFIYVTIRVANGGQTVVPARNDASVEFAPRLNVKLKMEDGVYVIYGKDGNEAFGKNPVTPPSGVPAHTHTQYAQDFTDLDDVPADYSGEAGKILAVNATENGVEFIPNIPPSSDFLALTDTPDDYSGNAGKAVLVNATEDALEFLDYTPTYIRAITRLADVPPVSPSALDDEFSDNSIDAKWTTNGPGGTPTATWTERDDGLLYCTIPARSSWGYDVLTQTAPAGDFTIVVGIDSRTAKRLASQAPAALVLMQGTASQAVMVFGTSFSTPAIWVQRGSALGTWVANTLVVNTNVQDDGYLKFQRVGTVWNFYSSQDGLNWHLIHTMTELWTVAKVGIGGSPENATHGVSATYKFFRANWTPATTFPTDLVVPGGPPGPTGSTGATGATGPRGGYGGNSIEMVYDSTTTDADPGSGKMRFNHATFTSITQMFFDDLDANAIDVQSWLNALDDSTNSVKGTLRIFKIDDPFLTWRILNVTGVNVDPGGYTKILVTPVISTGTWTNGDHFVITFSRAGDLPTGTLLADGSVTAEHLAIVQTIVTGSALSVTRNLSQSSTNAPVVDIVQDHATDDQPGLRVRQDATSVDVAQFINALGFSGLRLESQSPAANSGATIYLYAYDGAAVSLLGQLFVVNSAWSFGQYAPLSVGFTAYNSGGMGFHVTTAPIIFYQGNSDANLSTEIARFQGGNFGLGVTTLQGKFHVHDGVSGRLFTTKLVVNATPQVIIPDAAGDVTALVNGTVNVKSSGGGKGTAALALDQGGTLTADITVGASTWRTTLNTNGQLSVARTAGTDTASINYDIRWM